MRSLIPWGKGRRTAAPAQQLGDWLDRVWDDPWEAVLSPARSFLGTRLPSVDVSEDNKEVTVRAEIPGMTEKDIDLSWQDGVLRIQGEKKEEKEEKKKGRHYSECSYGSFRRDIPLGDNVDFEKAQAKYRHGVLTVALPKAASRRKAVQIEVE